MDPAISYKVDKNIRNNKKEYFFTTLNNRFELMNEKLQDLLEKRYQKEFEPIYILPAEPNKYHRKSNYIIINQKLKETRKATGKKNIISLPLSSDLNSELSGSSCVKRLVNDLSKKQNRIFFISFTSAGLDLENKKIINIGPQKEVVEKYDNKIEQIKLFQKMDLPRLETTIYQNEKSLRRTNIDHPVFISSSHTTGGAGNRIISSDQELKNFLNKLRTTEKNGKFFTSKYIKDVSLFPNSIGIVCGKNDSRVLCLTDQFISGTEHLGNIYPSLASENNRKKMFDITQKIGDHLSKKGFRGMYGCDFIIDSKNKLYLVELNPRRQSCYLILQMITKNINLLEVEFKLALGEEIPDLDHRDINCQYAWLQKKIKPNQKYQKLRKEIHKNKESDPFDDIGKNFISTYFPKKYIIKDKDLLGHYILSGKDRETILQRSQKEIKNILLDSIENAKK